VDLTYGPQYEAFRAEVRAFIEGHREQAPPLGAPRDAKARAWQRLLIERGYTARSIPKRYGGAGHPPDILEARILAEEFARARVSPGLGGQGVAMLVPTLLEVGTEEQKLRWVPPTLAGEIVWCQGYSEPGAGSDLASLRTSAVLDGVGFTDLLGLHYWFKRIGFDRQPLGSPEWLRAEAARAQGLLDCRAGGPVDMRRRAGAVSVSSFDTIRPGGTSR
jgi:alkylation response protein AidB-like acyl-CoA dehydrogenase